MTYESGSLLGEALFLKFWRPYTELGIDLGDFLHDFGWCNGALADVLEEVYRGILFHSTETYISVSIPFKDATERVYLYE